MCYPVEDETPFTAEQLEKADKSTSLQNEYFDLDGDSPYAAVNDSFDYVVVRLLERIEALEAQVKAQ